MITTYADIALAKYEDSLTTAKLLDQAVDALIAKPSADTLNAARDGLEGGAHRPTSRPRSTASATPSSTTGKAG